MKVAINHKDNGSKGLLTHRSRSKEVLFTISMIRFNRNRLRMRADRGKLSS